MDHAGAIFRAAGVLRQGQDLVLDLGGVGTVDSSAVALLASLVRFARAKGSTLRVLNAPEAIAHLASIYGLDDALPGLTPET